MPTYRAYLLDDAGEIRRREWIEAGDDGEAIRKAHDLCTPKEPAVELWQGARMVTALPCDPQA